MASRKKREVPHCDVQPSYGAAGEFPPRFRRSSELCLICLRVRRCALLRVVTGLPVYRISPNILHILGDRGWYQSPSPANERRHHQCLLLLRMERSQPNVKFSVLVFLYRHMPTTVLLPSQGEEPRQSEEPSMFVPGVSAAFRCIVNVRRGFGAKYWG